MDKGQGESWLRRQKNKVWSIAWCCLLFAALLPVPCAKAESLPYTLSAEYIKADGERHGKYVAVTATPQRKGVYLYASKSQTTGKPTEVSAAIDGAGLIGEALFPVGKNKHDRWQAGNVTKVYEGPVKVFIPLPESGGKNLSVRMTALACSAVNCTPLDILLEVGLSGKEWSSMSLPPMSVLEEMPSFSVRLAGDGAPRIASTAGNFVSLAPPAIKDGFIGKLTPTPYAPHLEVASLGKAIILGFLAGLILNLMPCVLPVIGIKLAALFAGSGTQEERTRLFRRHQLFFALGILAWFTCMAGIFHWFDLKWGQIFQSPVVVFALALMLLLLALNLFGVDTLPLIDLKAGNVRRPDLRAFVEGFTATLIATPCGGPLLGGVLGWAFMQPLGTLAITLESVGLGMAFPYLLLAAFPGLSKRFPRPGNWMVCLEHIVGFMLLGAVAYLVSLLPLESMPKSIFALVLASFGGWLWAKRRTTMKVAGVACVILACLLPFGPENTTGQWRGYSHASFEELLGKQIILVEFTADWCPTCKVVEATALTKKNRRAWEKEYDLAFFRVDMTRQNPEGEALLKALGSVSIPVIAVFSAGEDRYAPLVLRDIVTKGQIEEALERAVIRK